MYLEGNMMGDEVMLTDSNGLWTKGAINLTTARKSSHNICFVTSSV